MLIIEVAEIKGKCPVYKKGDNIVIDGPEIVLEKTDAICIHALASLLHYVVALREGVAPAKLGLSKDEKMILGKVIFIFICKELRIYKWRLKMIPRGNIIERIKSLPEESIREVADFIEFLEAKRKRLVKGEGEKEDPLSNVIGICEGPSDLAERHDRYVYG